MAEVKPFVWGASGVELLQSGDTLAGVGAGGGIFIESKTTTYNVVATDFNKLLNCSGPLTLNFASVATLGDGWQCYVHNIGVSSVTIEPYGSETIDGMLNVVMDPSDLFLIISTSTQLKCCRLNRPRPHYITESMTWTCPAGVYFIEVELWGAGGSGSKGSGTLYQGTGGGGGAYARKKLYVSPGVTKEITIGIGGASQTVVNSNGNTGGTSSFSSDVTCNGGYGGWPPKAAGAYTLSTAHATASGGDFSSNGGKGLAIKLDNAVTVEGISLGGGTFGIQPVISNIAAPTDGKYPGGGGTGSTSALNSGAGASGLCIIWY